MFHFNFIISYKPGLAQNLGNIINDIFQLKTSGYKETCLHPLKMTKTIKLNVIGKKSMSLCPDYMIME